MAQFLYPIAPGASIEHLSFTKLPADVPRGLYGLMILDWHLSRFRHKLVWDGVVSTVG